MLVCMERLIIQALVLMKLIKLCLPIFEIIYWKLNYITAK
jgi:hypothetical protein